MTLLIVIIGLALIFDFINGFHDAANSIATIVSTKVLTPFQAVLWAAVFNFVAFFIFKEHGIANTVAKTVDASAIDFYVILAGLISAIVWNLFTWWYGIPSSSSHTLIGGFAGAGIAKAGFGCLFAASIYKTLIFIILAPLIGMLVSMIITLIAMHRSNIFKIVIFSLIMIVCVNFIHFKNVFEKYGLVFICAMFILSYIYLALRGKNAYREANVYKKLQLASSAAFSIGHGGSDAQKVMGIISATLVYSYSIGGYGIPSLAQMPNWVVIACYSAIGLGTLSGGWKIVKTMGTKITKVTPLEGVCAETAGAFTLFTAANLGAPVSTTHTITGSIMGVGATKRLSAVRWGVTLQLVWAWVLTIPVSAIIAIGMYYLMKLFA